MNTNVFKWIKFSSPSGPLWIQQYLSRRFCFFSFKYASRRYHPLKHLSGDGESFCQPLSGTISGRSLQPKAEPSLCGPFPSKHGSQPGVHMCARGWRDSPRPTNVPLVVLPAPLLRCQSLPPSSGFSRCHVTQPVGTGCCVCLFGNKNICF